MRSRILGWGFRIIDDLFVGQRSRPMSSAQKTFVESLDINQVRTGTIDSLCEQLLREFRAPGTQPPVLVDEFDSTRFKLREGLFGAGARRDLDQRLDAFLLGLHSDDGNRFNFHAGTKANLVKEIWERRFQDQVIWSQFPIGGPAATRPARKLIDDAQQAYEAALRSAGFVDFSLLEDEVLKRVRAGQLKEFTDELKVVFVDEYQDTNLLQEQLYFELAYACGGALVVVGDDDQSLYRFRGATVDLFRNFPTRYFQRFNKTPTTVFLTNNYRSTRTIVILYAEWLRDARRRLPVRSRREQTSAGLRPECSQRLSCLGDVPKHSPETRRRPSKVNPPCVSWRRLPGSGWRHRTCAHRRRRRGTAPCFVVARRSTLHPRGRGSRYFSDKNLAR